MQLVIEQGGSFKVNEDEIDFLKSFCDRKDISFDACYRSVTGTFSFPPTHVGYIKFSEREVLINPRFGEFTLDDILLLYLINFDFNISNSLIDSFSLLLRQSNERHYLTDIWVRELRQLIRRGLPLKFNDRTTRSDFISGKVFWRETIENIRKNTRKPILSSCAVVSNDTINNQLFLLTLEKIKNNIDRRDYNIIRSYLPKHLDADQNIINRVSIDRGNVSASKCIELSKIILRDLVPMKLNGEKFGEAFIVNYDMLFQNFITKVLLSSNFGSDYFRPTVKTGYSDFSDSAGNLNKRYYIPDILFRPKKGSSITEAEGLIDVKNKFPDIFSNPDVYQMIFYCNELDTDKVVLIYPSAEEIDFIKLNLFGKNVKKIFACFFNIKSLQTGKFNAELLRFNNEVHSLLS